jgi:hypothetical protein
MDITENAEEDHGDDLFITQSAFRNREEPEDPEELDPALDMLNMSVATSFAAECAVNLFGDDLPLLSPLSKNDSSAPYNPATSDVSDDELVLSCQAVEAEQAKKNGVSDGKRFGVPLSENAVNELSKRRYVIKCLQDSNHALASFHIFSVADASVKKYLWAVNVFNAWKGWRNEQALKPGSTTSPIRVELVEMTNDELCFALTRFVLEAKKSSADPYPAETLYQLIMALQMYLSVHSREVNIVLLFRKSAGYF